MGNWRSYLKDDSTTWLLEDSHPAVKYLTLKNLLDRSEKDKEVIHAKKAIMKAGVVPRILQMQKGRFISLLQDSPQNK